jgi:hypothetical protein|nr:MAG TPA: hypothetical protein [Bacteriophage sp.]
MNDEVYEELEKLMRFFPDSFINRQLELILIPKTNTYFSLKDCFTKKDIISKVLMWCTRDIAKARPYQQQKRNIDFYVENRTRLEKYLGADINVNVVYHYLGNGVDEELTEKFISSGFDMKILYPKAKEVQDDSKI